MTKQALGVAVTVALALAAQPALARGSRGGGHPTGGRSGGYSGRSHAGGGHSSGGYAVPRGGGGYASRRAAEARHPSAGSGRYGRSSSYGRGHSPVSSQWRSPRYARGYGYRYGYGYGSSRGRYYGRYYGYYGGPYFSLSFGWPYSYGWSPYWSPLYSSSYTYLPAPYEDTYREVDPEASPDVELRDDSGSVPNTGRVRLEVRPDDATVYVDDEFWGTASESRFITLRAGRHTIDLVRPGFVVARREVEVGGGGTSDVLVELQR